MRNKTLVVALASLFCLVSVGAALAQETEVSGNAVTTTHQSTAIVEGYRLDPDANWLARASIPNEATLQDTYQYQVNPEQFKQVKADHVWQGEENPKSLSTPPCNLAYGSPRCREFLGG